MSTVLAWLLLTASLLASPETGARERSRQLAKQGTWTPAQIQELLALQLVDPERFVNDAPFRAKVLEALPRSLDPSVPPPLRDELLFELNQVRGIDFAASEAIEAGWGAIPRRALERKVPFPTAEADRLLFFDEAESPLAASVYSLPSFFFTPEAAEAFLGGVRKAAPHRTLIVLTDLPLRRRLEKSGLELRLLETYGRPYSPWPRDPFSLARSAAGGVVVVVRPNLQRGREDDAHALFKRLCGLAGATGLLAEEYDPATGRALGNHPQAYSHLALVNSALNLAQVPSPADRSPAEERAGGGS